ncbi:MAG: ABC transporter substrate-binding protein [Pseudonocardia sp.]|jgi:multiple sugar transport system substrate-binding protein|nr:ABC transporter substrate-binding protein [Pseudonocardia sp.]OJY37701.1 MAG: ABC transporter substrate-binding protein [Pseudonocardia sp. 73-21]
MRRRPLAVGAFVAATALLVSACGGGSSSSTSSGNAPAALDGVGPITLVQGKDTSNFVQGRLDAWNQQHPDQKVTLIELPEDADAQRAQMIQNANAKSDAYDVLAVDNVWTAEFAANRYIVELPTDTFPQTADFLPPVIDSAKYKDKLFAIPYASDGGMLYYRTDLLKAAGITDPPKTWADMQADCTKVAATPAGAGVSCYAGQFQKYEGLTVNFAEAVNSAGGVITDPSGKPDVNTPAAKAGLDFLVNGFKSGEIPKEAITYKEEEARRAFQEGKLVFERQWPYMYTLAEKTDGSSKVNGKFAVAPLPGLNGPGVSSLGGHALAISTYSKNKKTAADFINFYTSKESNTIQVQQASLAPVYTSIYDDATLQASLPYLTTLKASILAAQARPKVVRYGDATLAIQDAAYGAIQGNMTSDQALSQLQTKLEALTSGS